jgi:hypothetical protein
MHTHIRENQLKKEEEIKQREEALTKCDEELSIREEQLEKHKNKIYYVISLHAVGSTLCIIIQISS